MMRATMLTRRVMLGACVGGALWPASTHAQTIKRPAHIVVGFPAGGGTDIIARILADRLRGWRPNT